MTKMKSFPKVISARIDNDGEDDYLAADKDATGHCHADEGQTIRVGIYKLDHIREVTMETTSKPVK